MLKIMNNDMSKEKYKYHAFISYKHEDEKIAEWLQHKLEYYNFPTNLNGVADLPKKIRPICRDVTDFTPSPLKECISKALHDSQWLIVVCSPRSAQSPWVCKEAQTFIDMGREDHIIPFIIEGKPFSGNKNTECYPQSLLGLEGSKELLAADINDMGGRDAAAIKVVARMFELDFDVLWQRHEREKRRKRNWILCFVSLFIVMVLWVSGIVWSQNRKLIKTQSRIIGNEALSIAANGDNDKALQLLAEYTKDNQVGVIGYKTPEVEFALRKLYNTPLLVKNLKKHDKAISSIGFDPEGRYLLSTAVDDPVVWLWDVEMGCLKDSLVGHEGSINFAKFNHDGKRIVSAGGDGTFRIWDVESRKCCKVISNYANGRTACFGHEGASIITNTPPTKWDTTGARMCQYGSHAEFVAFNINNGLVATANANGTICLWNSDDGGCVDTLIGHRGWVKSVQFSTSGGLLVSASTDSTIRIWDINNKRCIHTITGHNDRVWYAEFSYNDSLIVSASSDSTCRIWDVKTGALVQTIKQPSEVYVAAFCPNKFQVACGLRNGSIGIFNLIGDDDMCFSTQMPIRSLGGLQIMGYVNGNKDMAVLFPRFSIDSVLASLSSLYSSYVSSRIEVFNLETGEWKRQCGLEVADSIKSVTVVRNSSVQENIITDAFPDFSPISNIPEGQKFHPFSYDNPFTGDSLLLYGISYGRNFVAIPTEGNMELYRISPLYFSLTKPSCKVVFYDDYLPKSWLFGRESDINHRFQDVSLSENYLIIAIRDSFYVWDIHSGRLVYEKNVGKHIINAVFAPGEDRIITITIDNAIMVWKFPPIKDVTREITERYKERPLTSKERRKYYLE